MFQLKHHSTKAKVLAMLMLWLSMVSVLGQNRVQSIQLAAAQGINLQLNIERLAVNELSTNAFYIILKAKNKAREELTLLPEQIQLLNAEEQITILKKSIGFLVEAKELKSGILSGELGISLRLLNPLPNGDWDVEAFLIEMNKIPTSNFYAGDSASNNTLKASDGKPLFIQNDMEIAISEGNAVFQIPLSFPTGTKEFYVMQQEISQKLYCAYLNALPLNVIEGKYPEIKGTLKGYLYDRNRNNITYQLIDNQYYFYVDANKNNIPNELEDGGEVACNFLSVTDMLSVLDWLGLRPITELEYEKAARGTSYPKPKEMAFGTQNVQNANTLKFTNTHLETSEEKGTDSSGLANHAFPTGGVPYLEAPFRSGFAFQKGNNRVKSGAGFYGTSDLSGNLWEQCVKINHREYKGILGDGNPLNPLPGDWRAEETNFYIPRGGAWLSLIFNDLLYPFRDLAISDRFYLQYNLNQRIGTIGGRGGL